MPAPGRSDGVRGRAFRAGAALLVALAALATGVAGSPGAAGAAPPSRQQATAIALRVLKPRPGTVVFALRAPVSARTRVGEATGPIRPAGRRAWLFWADESPYAYFQHASRLVLVDAANGRVLRSQRMSWWPVVGTKAPPFLRTRAAYLSPRYRVGPVVRRTSVHPRSLAAARALRDVPASAVQGDCLVSVGPIGDPMFEQSFEAWDRWARGAGMKSYRVSAAADGAKGPYPTRDDLDATIAGATKAGCKDVVLYLAGHGRRPPLGEPDPFADGGSFTGSYPKDEGVLPAVALTGTRSVAFDGDPESRITSRQLRATIDAFADAKIGFKVVVDSCFSGRFANDFEQRTPANLHILLTATSPSDVAYGQLYFSGDIPHEYVRNGVAKTRVVRVEVPAGRKKDGTGEFSLGLLGGWGFATRYDSDVQELLGEARGSGTPFVALALREAFRNRGPYDLAQQYGLTDARIVFKAKSTPAPTSAVLTVDGTSARLTVTTALGSQPIMFLRYQLPRGVQATAIGTPPAGCQVGAPTQPPSTVLIARCNPPLQPGSSTSFPFTTNGGVPAPGDRGTLVGSATGEAGSDVQIPISPP